MMDFFISSAWAQAAGAAGQPSPWPSLIMFGAVFVAMYFFMLRPQMKRAKEQRTMVEALAKGDEIVTNGGFAGRIVDIGETFLGVEVAPNVVIKVQKQAVSMVLPKGTLKSA
ncbi:MAG: preprotein translocase subunit YajC [Rudaea sp.]|uniref:preprotein translocase subunit YajC n=1 Tax=Rudaea sp. TaxID=2136325 RepID=UPI0039E710B0